MGYLSDYFVWTGRVFNSSIWRCIKPVPQSVADYDPWLANDPMAAEYHERCRYNGLAEDAYFMLDISLAYLTAMRGDPAKAKAILRRVKAKYRKYIEYRATVVKDGRDAQYRVDRAERQIALGKVH